MRFVPVALLLITVTLTAGCMEGISAQLANVRADEHVPTDYAIELEDQVSPDYARDVELPVESGARAIQASLRLDAQIQDQDSPFVPAQLTVSILDPSGSPMASRTLDPRNPKATLEVTEFPAFGTWKIHIEGRGLGGNGNGAAYHLAALVTY